MRRMSTLRLQNLKRTFELSGTLRASPFVIDMSEKPQMTLLRRGGEEPSGESFPGVQHCIQRILTDDKLHINQA